MNKQIKLLTILGSAAIIGGVSTLAVVTTSCGNDKPEPYTPTYAVVTPANLQVGDKVKVVNFVNPSTLTSGITGAIAGHYIDFDSEDNQYIQAGFLGASAFTIGIQSTMLLSYVAGTATPMAGPVFGAGYLWNNVAMSITFDVPKTITILNATVWATNRAYIFNNFIVQTN